MGSRREEGTGVATDDEALEKHARSKESGPNEEEERPAAGNILHVGSLLGPLPLVLIFAAALWVTPQILLLETDIMLDTSLREFKEQCQWLFFLRTAGAPHRHPSAPSFLPSFCLSCFDGRPSIVLDLFCGRDQSLFVTGWARSYEAGFEFCGALWCHVLRRKKRPGKNTSTPARGARERMK